MGDPCRTGKDCSPGLGLSTLGQWGPGSGHLGNQGGVWNGGRFRAGGGRDWSQCGWSLTGYGPTVRKEACPYSCLGSSSVALPTKHVAVQKELAIVTCFNRQGLPTVLTLVTLRVEVLVQSERSHGLIALMVSSWPGSGMMGSLQTEHLSRVSVYHPSQYGDPSRL